MRVATYRGIGIVENYGYYSPVIDRTIEEINFSKVIEWIDKTLGDKSDFPKKITYTIDRYIIGEYVMKARFQNN